MTWLFLYIAGGRLSRAELSGARLDGDVVEVGDAYMPADAVETREMRAASLRADVPAVLAVTRATAAWVHGALAEPPARHRVQRVSRARIHHVLDHRLLYRDQLLGADVVQCVAGLWLTTPERTLADLARDLQRGEPVAADVDALLSWRPALAAAAADLLASGRAVHYRQPAIAFLRDRAAGPGQAEVTR